MAMVSEIGIYLLVFVSALLLAVVLTPLARRLGLRMKVVDHPDPRRKVHTIPTPRLGGIAIFISTVVAGVILRGAYQELSAILVGAALASFLGLWDDRFTLPAWAKLIGQLVAAGLLIMMGVRVSMFPTLFLNVLVTLLWMVGITNALNLLDNMDGLSAGVAAIAAAHFAIMCAFSGQYLVGALAMAVTAACAGFLLYNWNPATIFMGDSGTLFLGFTLAALGIKLRFPDNVPFVTWMIPVIVLGLPIFDTTLVTLSRLKRRKNPLTSAGKDHTSHRLTYAGLSRREAVFLHYIAALVLGLVAIFVTQANVWEGYLVGGLLVLAAAYALWRLERLPFWPAPDAVN